MAKYSYKQMFFSILILGLPLSNLSAAFKDCDDYSPAVVGSGITGSTGSTGATGPTGPAQIGPVGIAGNIGATAVFAATGVTGATSVGAQGATGALGNTGITGTIGSAGVTGQTGALGATGAAQTLVINGFTGSTGATGAVGNTGATGLQGLEGSVGSSTQRGPQGPDAVVLVNEFEDYAYLDHPGFQSTTNATTFAMPLSLGIVSPGITAGFDFVDLPTYLPLPSRSYYLVNFTLAVYVPANSGGLTVAFYLINSNLSPVNQIIPNSYFVFTLPEVAVGAEIYYPCSYSTLVDVGNPSGVARIQLMTSTLTLPATQYYQPVQPIFNTANINFLRMYETQ